MFLRLTSLTERRVPSLSRFVAGLPFRLPWPRSRPHGSGPQPWRRRNRSQLTFATAAESSSSSASRSSTRTTTPTPSSPRPMPPTTRSAQSCGNSATPRAPTVSMRFIFHRSSSMRVSPRCGSTSIAARSARARSTPRDRCPARRPYHGAGDYTLGDYKNPAWNMGVLRHADGSETQLWNADAPAPKS